VCCGGERTRGEGGEGAAEEAQGCFFDHGVTRVTIRRAAHTRAHKRGNAVNADGSAIYNDIPVNIYHENVLIFAKPV
jgi:hypothetical protein